MVACGCRVCISPDKKDKRLRSSVLVNVNNKNILIDTGPDLRYQMLRSKTTRLDGILITHGHKDHTAGLDDVRAFNWHNKSACQVYAEERVIKGLQQEFAYAFSESKYPGVPDIILNKIDTSIFLVEDIPVTPIRAFHHKLPLLGFRIGDITYITDANYLPDEEYKKVYGTKVLVINGLRHKPHLSHFTLGEALEVIKEFNPEQAYITHISHQLGLHEEVSKTLPRGVALAYDGLQIVV